MNDTRTLRKDMDEALRKVLTAAQAVEEAVEMHDWQRAERCNASLYDELQPLDRLLTTRNGKGSRAELSCVAEYLREILERHERATAKLYSVRADAAAALQRIRTGRRGAAGYLATADA